MANAFSNIRFAAPASGPPVSRPALINIPISGRSPCSGGGSVNVTGNMSGNDPTGTTFTLLLQMTTTLSDCREGDIVINGDPYMSTAGSFRVTGGNFSADMRDGGGFSFTGGVAGSCQQDITTSVNVTGGRSSGTLTCRGNGWSVVHTVNIPF